MKDTNFSNDVAFDCNKSLLNFRIAILPSRTTDVVAVEISDALYVSARWMHRGTAIAAVPLKLVTDLIVQIFDRTNLESHTGSHFRLAERTFQIGVDSVERQSRFLTEPYLAITSFFV